MKKLYFLSVYQADKTLDDNMLNHVKTFQKLQNSGFYPIHVAGFYKGIPEESILISGIPEQCEELVKDICKEFNQESYLRVNEFNGWFSELVYLDNDKIESIGNLTEVSPIEVLNKFDSYSIINERYYVCK
jgi:hypothetical protein